MTIGELLEKQQENIEILIEDIGLTYLVEYELLEEYDLTLNELIADVLNAKVIGREDEFYIVEIANSWVLNSFEKHCEEE